MSDDVAIRFDNVSKSFKLPHEKHGSIKNVFLNVFRGRTTYEKQQVLKDVSFEIKKGEFFGIVGRNGSGKSTLLKLMAGIYSPDKGAIAVNGKLTPFIELGVGFNPELTGRENVFLNGALLGFSREEMESMYDEIVEFAELEKFMDQKLKNYSSGMQVRLAFSIAIKVDSPILLLDEVLAVGDEAFQKKCNSYFAFIKKQKKTVILVTHDMNAVKRFCDKALLLDEGQIVAAGESPEVADKYSKINEEVELRRESNRKKPNGSNKYKKALIKTELLNQEQKNVSSYGPKDKIIIRLTAHIKATIENPVIGLTVEKSNGETVFSTTTEHPEKELPSLIEKGKSYRFTLELQNIFGEDIYEIDVALVSKDRGETYFREDEAASFKVKNRGQKGWLLHPEKSVNLSEVKKHE